MTTATPNTAQSTARTGAKTTATPNTNEPTPGTDAKTTTDSTAAIQDQLLESVKQSQKTILELVESWSKNVQSTTPSIPAAQVPAGVPQPAEVIANAYDFAEKLLHNQREFSQALVGAITPPANTDK
jgi:hypothetical protein